MTWILAADAGELADDEAQELAAEQRHILTVQRSQQQPITGLAGCLPGAGPERPLDFSWLRQKYVAAYTYLAAIWPC